MRVLFLDQFSVLGGAQLCLLDVLEAANRRGWEARVALPGEGPLVARLQALHIGVDTIPCGPYRSGGKSFADAMRLPLDVRQQRRILTGWIAEGRFNLIYVNGPRLLPSAALAAGDRVPVLFHAHNRLHQDYAARLAGWAIRRYNATVIACSKYVAAPLARYVSKGRLHMIPNGTPDAGFRERAFGAGRSWRIGQIGRISPEKGQAEFVEAAALLAPEFPGARFVICGAQGVGAEKYLKSVSQRARGLPVEFLGWRDDIAAVLAELDLLIVPSKDEGMGRVVVEAFSAGVPVVAFATGGIPEVITHRETGFLIGEPTAEALAAQIREVIRGDADALRRIAARARRRWESSYMLAVYQRSITNLMEQAVSDWQTTHETTGRPARK